MRASVNVSLISVYRTPSAEILYRLLAERRPAGAISHGEMPTLDEHRRFMSKHAYKAWYLIRSGEMPVGSIYLTKGKEVGVTVFKKYRNLGYEASAIRILMEKHKETIGVCLDGRRHRVFVFNVAPKDHYLTRIISSLGFVEMQRTFEHASVKQNGKYSEKLV